MSPSRACHWNHHQRSLTAGERAIDVNVVYEQPDLCAAAMIPWPPVPRCASPPGQASSRSASRSSLAHRQQLAGPAREDTRAYAARLAVESVDVIHIGYAGTMHAFLNFCGGLSRGPTRTTRSARLKRSC